MKEHVSFQELLQKRAELNARLVLIPYEGSIEIKTRNNKYIYLRRKLFERCEASNKKLIILVE